LRLTHSPQLHSGIPDHLLGDRAVVRPSGSAAVIVLGYVWGCIHPIFRWVKPLGIWDVSPCAMGRGF
jgi:hypothetical protein